MSSKHGQPGLPASSQITALALVDERLSSSALRILGILGLFADESGHVRMTVPVLADLYGLRVPAGLSPDREIAYIKNAARSVRAYLAELARLGYVVRHGQAGYHGPAHIQLTVPQARADGQAWRSFSAAMDAYRATHYHAQRTVKKS